MKMLESLALEILKGAAVAFVASWLAVRSDRSTILVAEMVGTTGRSL